MTRRGARTQFGLAATAVLGLALSGCAGYHVSYENSALPQGMKVKASAYEISRGYYEIIVAFTPTRDGPFSVRIVDADIVGEGRIRAETSTDGKAGTNLYADFRAYLDGSTKIEIQPADESSLLFSADFNAGELAWIAGQGELLVWILLSAAISILAWNIRKQRVRTEQAAKQANANGAKLADSEKTMKALSARTESIEEEITKPQEPPALGWDPRWFMKDEELAGRIATKVLRENLALEDTVRPFSEVRGTGHFSILNRDELSSDWLKEVKTKTGGQREYGYIRLQDTDDIFVYPADPRHSVTLLNALFDGVVSANERDRLKSIPRAARLTPTSANSYKIAGRGAIQLLGRPDILEEASRRRETMPDKRNLGGEMGTDAATRKASLREARVLDQWMRSGFLGAKSGADYIEKLRLRSALCRISNQLATQKKPELPDIGIGGVSLEWVRINTDPKHVRVDPTVQAGVWLSCNLVDRTRLIVPASRALLAVDIAILQAFFQGAQNVTPENASSIRVFRPAILPPSGKWQDKERIETMGRVLVGDDNLSESEYLILAAENTLLALWDAALATKLPVPFREAPASSAPATSPPQPKPKGALDPDAQEPEPPPLPLEMPDLWWNEPLQKAVARGMQPEDYLARLVSAEEWIAKEVHVAGPDWASRLALVRFDFGENCLIVNDVVKTEKGVAIAVNGQSPEPLHGRDLYQIALLVYHPDTKKTRQSLVFIPLGEFLLDNHVTVFEQLIRDPPQVPEYLTRIVRPATIEKIKGPQKYRIVPGGKMRVEVRIEE